MIVRSFALALVAALVATPAVSLTMTGTASALNAYSFTLDGYEVYLLGVDSVERGQTCLVDRRDWDCGVAAIRHLEEVLFEGEVTCESVFGPDDSDRVIALCTLNGTDLGGRLVGEGFAVTLPNETTRYDALQDEARAAGLGLWQGQFTRPAVYRMLPMAPKSARPAFSPAAPID